MAEQKGCVTLKEHIEALRMADQRAVELLAKTEADRVKINILILSLVISIAGLCVSILYRH